MHVFFAHRATSKDQAKAGYNTAFEWDIDLTEGYEHSFLNNVARHPDVSAFAGCDTPEIGARLDERNFDALMVDGWRLKAHLQGLFAANRRGIPVIVRGDSTLQMPRSALKSLSKRIVYPVFLRRFSAALYVGTHSREYFEKYRFPQDRLFHSPHCVDTEFFRMRATPEARRALRERLGVASNAILLLFAGRLVPFKRPQDLVTAAAQLRAQGLQVEVAIAGSGPLESAVTAMAEQASVPLHKLGFLNQTMMPAAYAAADILVLPSNGEETWGLVCNEAMASGTPVVVSDHVGCAPDLASDQRTGNSYRCGDPASLAKTVARMIAAPPSRAELATATAANSVPAAADGIEKALNALQDKTRIDRAAKVTSTAAAERSSDSTSVSGEGSKKGVPSAENKHG